MSTSHLEPRLHMLPVGQVLPLFSTEAASAMSVGWCLPLLCALCAVLGCWLSLMSGHADVPRNPPRQSAPAHLRRHCETRG